MKKVSLLFVLLFTAGCASINSTCEPKVWLDNRLAECDSIPTGSFAFRCRAYAFEAAASAVPACFSYKQHDVRLMYLDAARRAHETSRVYHMYESKEITKFQRELLLQGIK